MDKKLTRQEMKKNIRRWMGKAKRRLQIKEFFAGLFKRLRGTSSC